MRGWISRNLRPESESMLHLDALRLVAAAGIIVLHLSEKIDWGTRQPHDVRFLPMVLFVDMFFVISGYVISTVYGGRVGTWASYGKFLRKRAARLGPLHWATLGLFLGAALIAESAGVPINHPEVFSWRCLPGNIINIQAMGIFCPIRSFNTPAWSISAEMAMYLAFPLIAWTGARGRWLPLIGCVVAWITLDNVSGGAAWMTWMVPSGIWRAIPSFLFGCALSSLRGNLVAVPFAESGLVTSMITFAVGCILRWPLEWLLAIIYLTVLFAVAADAQGHRHWAVRVAAAGGQLTYSSYMLHLLVINVLLTGIASHFLHLHGVAQNIAVVLTFIAIWPLSFLSLVLFERPARQFLNPIEARHTLRNGNAKQQIGDESDAQQDNEMTNPHIALRPTASI